MKKKRAAKMDRISDLPDHIVHHIMSFLTTSDLTKLSILSRRFFFLWSSFPVVDFDQSTFNRRGVDDFLDHIHNSILLRRRRRIDAGISEFRVKTDLKGVSGDRRLDFAISFALDNGVKSMDLNLGFAKYNLPAFFASSSINVLSLQGLTLDLCKVILTCPSLTDLSLTSCKFKRDAKFSTQTLRKIELRSCVVKFIKINAPKLHSFFFDSDAKDPKPCKIDVLECQNIAYLSLNNVVNAQDWVEKHTSTLSKLETFIFNGCEDIDSISIWNERVETIEISNCPLLTSIRVIAPSLESFQFKGTDLHMVSNISFIDSKSIKDLYIENAGISDEWLEAQLVGFCYLESLRLKGCNSLKKIEVNHEKLQILELLNCLHLEEAEIDTPQLISFVHLGNIIEFEKMVTRSICTATLYTKPWITYNNEKFYGWRKLLSFFGHCKALKLFCNSEKELIIPEDLREILVPPLYDLQTLEVYVKSLKRIETDLMDSLLWLSPLPNTIRISYASRQMILEFVYYDETMKEEGEDRNPFCCRSKPVKCWRHKLKRLDIHTTEVLYTNGLAELQKYFLTNAMMLETLSFSTMGFND